MPAIFISYRRSDSAAIVGRIYDRLVDRYGAESIFFDIDSIVPGQNFHDRIKDTLERSDIVLVVVGLGWRGPREDGQYRIYHADDLVRTEVEMDLKAKVA